MAKRGENIYKRKDGRWEGRYIKERRSGGKSSYGYVYARKYSDCKAKLEKTKALHRYNPNVIKQCGTGSFRDYLQYWIYSITMPHVKASTCSNYTAIAQKWLLPFFGERTLYKITREEVQSFINGLLQQELAPGTIRNIYNVMHAVMRNAQEYDYISVNPCEGVRIPKMKQKEAQLLTLEEQKKLEKAARADKNGFAILLASYTGLRIGEICALTWQDVDLDNGVLHVSRTIRRVQCLEPGAETRTVVTIGTAKSERSKRTIPLPAGILKLFREHREISDGEYVFAYHGHPLEPRTLQYQFKVILKKAGLTAINFHALRHTFATRCIELRFDIKTLSEILGHTSAKMTLDRYGHSQMDQKRNAMKNLDGLLSRYE